MNAQAILLFCQYFPYKGGEQFLFNEAEYYTENTEIYVCSQNNRTRPTIDLPANILITDFDFGKLPAVRGIIRTYWKLIIRVFLTEFYHSPHRYRYFRYFKTHFFLLVGYLQKAQVIKNQLPKNRKIKIYSYWFDEWATIIHLLKRISNDQLYIICRMHGYDFDEAQVERGYHLFRYFDLSGFDKVISVSDYGRNYIRRKYNFSGVEVHKLGVRDKGNNPLNFGQDFTIVSCSALIPLKRVHLIVHLLKEMKTNITWTHFGNGPLEREILQEAQTFPSWVKFQYRGQVDNNVIINFYRNHTVDLFMNVSELEGIPVSLMEAISFGIPVVGCNICGVPEIVNSQTGLLLEKDFEIKDTAGRIETFLTQQCRDINFRKGIKSYWESSFNADTNYPDFIKKYLLN